MHLFEPWVAMRLVAGLVAAGLFSHAAWVSLKVLRYEHLGHATEGQLVLERQAELAATSARVGAVIQIAVLLLSVFAADRLTNSLRGAMCGYGVVHANSAGPWSIAATLAASIGAGIHLQLLALDRSLHSRSLLRPVSMSALGVATLALIDCGLAAQWLGTLDFSVVASCCSAGVDTTAEASQNFYSHSAASRIGVTAGSLLMLPLATATALKVAKTPHRNRVIWAVLPALIAFVLALATSVLEVAPYVYEVPHHRCPYCLFRADAYGIGYVLFGSILLAFVWACGAALSALWLPPHGDTRRDDPFPRFVRRLLRKEAIAWSVAFAVGLAPVVRFAIMSRGASLF